MRRPLLAPFTVLYALVVSARNAAYDAGLFRARRAPVPVISVGNLASGGTGKTPVVEHLAAMLAADGLRVAVLSRGYRRRTKGFQLASDGSATIADAAAVGDEPAQMVRNLPGVLVAVDEDRVRGAERLAREHGANVIILDDGFQHRRLLRDLDIVLVTTGELLNGESLLPAGDRREPASSLRRAHGVIVTGFTGLAEEATLASVRPLLPPHLAVGAVQTEVREFRRAGERQATDPGTFTGRAVAIFSGIGNAAGFRRTVAGLGFQVVGERVFRDHHQYTSDDLASLRRWFGPLRAELLITTQKDIVRLTGHDADAFIREMPVYVASVRPRWISGRAEIERLVRGAAGIQHPAV